MRSVNNSAELMLLFKRPFFGGFTFSVAYGSFYFPGEFNGTFGNRTQSNLIERLSSIDEQNRTHKKFGQSNAMGLMHITSPFFFSSTAYSMKARLGGIA